MLVWKFVDDSAEKKLLFRLKQLATLKCSYICCEECSAEDELQLNAKNVQN